MYFHSFHDHRSSFFLTEGCPREKNSSPTSKTDYDGVVSNAENILVDFLNVIADY